MRIVLILFVALLAACASPAEIQQARDRIVQAENVRLDAILEQAYNFNPPGNSQPIARGHAAMAEVANDNGDVSWLLVMRTWSGGGSPPPAQIRLLDRDRRDRRSGVCRYNQYRGRWEC